MKTKFDKIKQVEFIVELLLRVYVFHLWFCVHVKVWWHACVCVCLNVSMPSFYAQEWRVYRLGHCLGQILTIKILGLIVNTHTHTEREMENAYSCDQVLEVCPKQSFLYNKSVCTGIILWNKFGTFLQRQHRPKS